MADDLLFAVVGDAEVLSQDDFVGIYIEREDGDPFSAMICVGKEPIPGSNAVLSKFRNARVKISVEFLDEEPYEEVSLNP